MMMKDVGDQKFCMKNHAGGKMKLANEDLQLETHKIPENSTLKEMIESVIEQVFLEDVHLKRITFSMKDDRLTMQKIYEEKLP